MTTTMTLRPYQREAIDALMRSFRSDKRRQVVLLPTGMGKTVVIANLISTFRAANPNAKVLVLAHREELVTQAADKIASWNPGLSVGIVKARRNEIEAAVIVASVQTLRSAKRREALGSVGLVIIDECHHAAAKTYLDIVRALGGFDGVPVAGFTATLERNDLLGLGDIWQGVAYRKDIAYAIEHGYLVAPQTIRVELQSLNLDGVAKTGGDYSSAALGEAMHDAKGPSAIAAAFRIHAGARQGVIFAPTVALAHEISDALSALSVTNAVISGDTPSALREDIYAATRAKRVQVLVNVMVLTEGFDMPQLEVAVIARPTSSRSLYVQMVGRVLRLHPGKHRALVIDVVGASHGMTLASAADLSTSSEAEAAKRDAGARAGAAGANDRVSYSIKIVSRWFVWVAVVKRTQEGRTRTIATIRNRNREACQREAIAATRFDRMR